MVACSGDSRQDGHQMLARHWITWRDTLEGFLRSPGVKKGGGIQSCIRDALRYNCCPPVQQVSANALVQNTFNTRIKQPYAQCHDLIFL
jgi:hypothetical protein